jgi:hypothetical protein
VAKEGERVRVEVAFEGGQIVAGLVGPESVESLRAALSNGSAVFDLETEDGTYVVALNKVVYLKRFSRETRIGFGDALR